MSTPIPAGKYNIKNLASGSTLDLALANPTEGTLVQGWHANGSEGQKWILKYDTGSTNFITLQNSATMTYVSFTGVGDCVAVIGSQVSRLLQPTKIDTNTYILAAASQPNYVLDILDGKPEDGRPVLLKTGKGVTSQKWVFTSV
ncbi:hypothetical protein RSOLAG22IIIB_07383 [Rhizoctonia solani]|uniref:Ricin B lectin domain-containing protein n=1 Tax=Rhizoctonia solani TaxID=456999 RepID=A0A0K6FMM5_9AGAM|nr:hypothetical protein RSOLAG22IIIB_07383 [Rhizoctonia solani]